MRIDFTAPQHVLDTIAGLGRTEDVKFSPSNKRLAIAAYRKNEIAVFDVNIDASPDGAQINLPGVVEIFSSQFNEPHGLDFLDEETIIVSNRSGDVPIFKLPGKAEGNRHELEPLAVIDSSSGLDAPGSIAVTRPAPNVYEALICNNDGNSITKHLLDFSAGCSLKRSEVLLKKWLDIPDGICVSTDSQWIAISNHKMHSVLVYENNQEVNEASDPDGILRRVFFPHGVRFTADGRHLLVADAGAPYVHIYRRDGPSWRGVRNPLTSFRVMSEDVFLRGRYNPMEGGPKGVDIDNDAMVFVTTNECQNLAFFDLAKVLEQASENRPEGQGSSGSEEQPDANARHRSGESVLDDPSTYALRYELEVQRHIHERLKTIEAQGDAELAKVTNSSSWRVTAPLRSVISVFRKRRRSNRKGAD